MFLNWVTFLLLIAITIQINVVQCKSTTRSYAKQAQFIRSGLTNIFWEYVDSVNFTSLGLTVNCFQSLNFIAKSLEQGDQWTLEIIDASGRAPVDLTGIGYLDTGNFDHCLSLFWFDASNKPEVGQYCLISMIPSSNTEANGANILTKNKVINLDLGLVIQIGLCLPSSCSAKDIKTITSRALDQYSWKVTDVNCQIGLNFLEKLHQASLIQKVTILLLLINFSTVILATLIQMKSQNHGITWIKHFSLFQGYRLLTEPDKSMNRMPFLTKLVILIHSIGLPVHIIVGPFISRGYTLNAASLWSLKNFDNPWYRGILAEGGSTVLVVYSGITRSLILWRDTKHDTPFIKTLQFVAKRAILASILMAILVLLQNLIPLISNGPLNSIILESTSYDCIPTAFDYIFFFQSLKTSVGKNLCIPHTWSTATDQHLIIFLVILVHLYKKLPRFALITNIALILVSLTYIGQQFYLTELGLHPFSRKHSRFEFMLWMVNFYTHSSNYIWLFGLTMLITYLIKTYDTNHWLIKMFKQNAIRKMAVLGLAVIALPLIWEITLHQYETPLLRACYAIFYRILIAVYFTVYIVKAQDAFLVYFSSQVEKNLEYKRKRISFKKYRILHILSNILESTYFIHVTIITWCFSQQRWPLLTFMDWIGQIIWLSALSIIGGILFFLFILSPLRSFFASYTGKNKFHAD